MKCFLCKTEETTKPRKGADGVVVNLCDSCCELATLLHNANDDEIQEALEESMKVLKK